MILNGWLDTCWKGPQLSDIGTKDARGLDQEESVQRARSLSGGAGSVKAETH